MSPDRPSLQQAVSLALMNAPQDDRDVAGIALARHYAGLIDEAARIADELESLEGVDEDGVRTIATLKAKVQAQSVASDLGPKFLAALAALGLTPAARAAIMKGGAPSDGHAGTEAALVRLRSRRGSRPDGA